MSWQLRITDPSGETRIKTIQGTMTVGRSEQSHIILRDPTAAPEAATLWSTPQSTSSPFWIKIPYSAPVAYLGDLAIREAHVPPGIPFQIGDTKMQIEAIAESRPLPTFPSGARPWLTCSESGRQTLWTAKKASETPLAIYLAGETGTGKEVMAHLIHAWSPRKSGAFVPLHCGALPISLAESELFGHVKGAFTGAVQHRPGALMQAHGGSLFLDEIGDLPLDIQVKLLRFLENGEIRPVGADRPSRADVRLICATHHPLLKLVEQGKFRRDLYFRLASVALVIPSLRSRPEDIEMLAVKFASDLQRTLSPRAMLRLKAHSWPGNVRELRHAIERASGLAGTFASTLAEEAFDFLIHPENQFESSSQELGATALTLHEMERVMLIKALNLSHGHRAKSAKILGVARSTVFEMLKRHKICGPKMTMSELSHY
jgi:transcriptional regulator with PAS, ATPase and Fis domain